MFLASNSGSVKERAEMLARVRTFFAEKNVLEADTPILSLTAPVDAFIEVMKVEMGEGKIGYLHTSPEYGLKKLLAQGSGDLYQLGHVFRAEEESPLHSPEFTMLEWYRIGMDYRQFIEETCDLIRLFLPALPTEVISYREAFLRYGSLDYVKDNLIPHILPYTQEGAQWDRDTQLNLLFTHLVEPQLGKENLTVITEYPASQAALAKTATIDGTLVARRFEVYYEGIELANGFDELNNSQEQRARLIKENEKRITLGKIPLPLDEEFIRAVDQLPECCGVAVGFDRLMKLKSQFKAEKSLSLRC